LDPAIDRGVIDVQTPFKHHLFQVAVAERIAQIPAHTQHNDVSFKVAPFEGMLLIHEKAPLVLIRSRAYHTIVIFATQPFKER
jgi:hypothetical protein